LLFFFSIWRYPFKKKNFNDQGSLWRNPTRRTYGMVDSASPCASRPSLPPASESICRVRNNDEICVLCLNPDRHSTLIHPQCPIGHSIEHCEFVVCWQVAAACWCGAAVLLSVYSLHATGCARVVSGARARVLPWACLFITTTCTCTMVLTPLSAYCPLHICSSHIAHWATVGGSQLSRLHILLYALHSKVLR
jgi:hypothetical protein